MSSKDRRIIITQTQQSPDPLPTCNPNLMPFRIGYTGPAAVSMFLRVEKMKSEDEMKEQNDNMDPNVKDEDVEMRSNLLVPANHPVQVQDSQPPDVEMTTSVLPASSSSSPTPIPSASSSSKTLSGSIQASDSMSTLISSESQVNSSILTASSSASSTSNLLPQTSSSALKDIDKRFISSFRGRTIHGLTVDVPIGYTGLLLQSDPQPTTTHVNHGFEGEEEEMDSGGRKTRSKGEGIVKSDVNGFGKGKAKEKEKEHTKKAPLKGRLARTAAPKRVVEPEVITVDNGDQEMTDPAPSTTEPAAEVTNGASKDLKLTNDDTDGPDSLDNDLKEIPLRKLIPQSTFSSITLWHADRAVDETRDEYYRTLTEWMALSHEIHRTDL